MRSAFIGVALALSLWTAPALGQNLPPWWTKVQVAVEGADDMKDRVSSWLTEEVRRMHGVEVVDSAAEWEINIVVLQTKNQGGVVTGYALSEVVLSRVDQPQFFRNVAAADTVRSHRDVWSTVTTTALVAGGLQDHQLVLGPMNDLRNAVEGLAADFDTKQLEPSRKLWEKTVRSVRRP